MSAHNKQNSGLSKTYNYIDMDIIILVFIEIDLSHCELVNNGHI